MGKSCRLGARAHFPLVDEGGRGVGVVWGEARAALSGLPGGGLNIAHEAVVRHAAGEAAERVALRWIGKSGARRDITYAELEAESARFANALLELGVEPGDAVFGLAGRVPELYVAALGALRVQAVFCPLFSAFGPEPIASRMQLGKASVLVTSERLWRRKVAPIRERLPDLEHVILIDGTRSAEGTLGYADLVERQPSVHTIEPTSPETPALLHFTSGTTGAPKGALHVHEAVVMHHHSARIALDLRAGDVFWCTADPGWVTGTSYGIIAPLVVGVTMVVDEAEMNVERWYDILESERVTVWYTAPTAIRMLMKAGEERAAGHDFSALRFLASVGEPLDPEAVLWGERVFGHPFHDGWWQTETGGIMIANCASAPVRPGSMGKAIAGVEAAVVSRETDLSVRVIEAPGETGELALRPGWPSMMREYLGAPERYAKCFADGWYLSGDLVKRDEDGYFWFVARADDLIKSAGHLIGPFEVESALIEHEAVAEAGVIGKPDPVAGKVVKAFVALVDGCEASPELRRELMAHARRRLGSAVAPREIEIVDDLPKTRSGKIMRRLLEARELGLPVGDTSTLERPENA